MDKNIKRESEDLPNEKKKLPLGKSFSSAPAVLNSFTSGFKEEKKRQLLTTVSICVSISQLLSKEQKAKRSPSQAPTIFIGAGWVNFQQAMTVVVRPGQ